MFVTKKLAPLKMAVRLCYLQGNYWLTILSQFTSLVCDAGSSALSNYSGCIFFVTSLLPSFFDTEIPTTIERAIFSISHASQVAIGARTMGLFVTRQGGLAAVVLTPGAGAAVQFLPAQLGYPTAAGSAPTRPTATLLDGVPAIG